MIVPAKRRNGIRIVAAATPSNAGLKRRGAFAGR
jgi:hypothetical protein